MIFDSFIFSFRRKFQFFIIEFFYGAEGLLPCQQSQCLKNVAKCSNSKICKSRPFLIASFASAVIGMWKFKFSFTEDYFKQTWILISSKLCFFKKHILFSQEFELELWLFCRHWFSSVLHWFLRRSWIFFRIISSLIHYADGNSEVIDQKLQDWFNVFWQA